MKYLVAQLSALQWLLAIPPLPHDQAQMLNHGLHQTLKQLVWLDVSS
jgi:hypothetical protein